MPIAVQSFAGKSSPDNHVPEGKKILLLKREGDSGRRVTLLYSHINCTLEDRKLMRGRGMSLKTLFIASCLQRHERL